MEKTHEFMKIDCKISRCNKLILLILNDHFFCKKQKFYNFFEKLYLLLQPEKFTLVVA